MVDFQDFLPLMASFSMMKSAESSVYPFLTIVLGIFIRYVVEHGEQLQSYLRAMWFSRKCFTVAARISYIEGAVSTYNIPKTFNAIQHSLMKSITCDKATKTSYSVENIYTSYANTIQIVTFNNNRAIYNITPTICISQDVKNTTCDKEGSVFVKYTLYVWSSRNNYEEVKVFINQCEEAFETSIQTTKPTIFTLSKMDPFPYFEGVPFTSTKTFDNMFFQQKEELKQRLDFFQNNKDHYDRLGIPYTLGMMFNGLPGTGKTSVIKAIANYTRRHLVIVPMDKVTTVDQLEYLHIIIWDTYF